jgi:hypothetical protein
MPPAGTAEAATAEGLAHPRAGSPEPGSTGSGKVRTGVASMSTRALGATPLRFCFGAILAEPSPETLDHPVSP